MSETDFRYAVNDELTALAERFRARIPDDVLNELTHHVADVLAEYRDREGEDDDDPPCGSTATTTGMPCGWPAGHGGEHQ